MTELLAPAGDLEKLKIALLYGADAVFIGGQQFSLRARASNFTVDDIKEATTFAHNLNKKVYVTTNIIPHHEDMHDLIEYLQALEEAKVDAIIAASPYIVDTALKHTNLEVHISTQQSALNTQTVQFWTEKKASRVVLGRELTVEEIKGITSSTDTEIEVFIHGGMCMSYSGRCSLSDNMTGRDANRGGCAHSCRWNYDLKENNESFSEEVPFSMSSKDLEAVHQITKLIDANVSSLKIEGRMKSLHYIATVVSTYRQMIDEYVHTKEIKDYEYYVKRLKKAENRLASSGFLEGVPGVEQQLYQMRSEKPSQNFIGIVLAYDEKTQTALVEQRNYFEVGTEVEVMSHEEPEKYFKIEKMTDLDGNDLDIARRPKEQLLIHTNIKLHPYDLIRCL
ncbi:Peptidase U32 family protein [Alteracholeplasma palmae J233]|uniref:Peptidase U32 family protein n=1 Tax=Alteracholeplasma palmae (strain ATCC 49389 / J233) TaxID=1318466 RepID=U4KKT4_ALTPJ|nr:U32 family peptidase [Alteracholeplasma palmae]CCV64273.1 Peptidase U32 family protein [Alteracholeplasma palmae J233]